MANPLVEALERADHSAWDMDAPLRDKLKLVADVVRSLSARFADAVDRMVIRLQETRAGAAAPEIGDRMPPFVLPDDKGRLVALEDLLALGPVAISFNRGHWCPCCRLNVHALADLQEELTDEGRQLVAIVPERRKFVASLREESCAPFPVLTDMDNGYALSLPAPAGTSRSIRQFGMDGADPGDVRRRRRRRNRRALSRSRLSFADGDRSAPCSAQGDLFASR